MTARLGSKYRYFGKLVLVSFRYFSIDIYRNIDIFDNTTIIRSFMSISTSFKVKISGLGIKYIYKILEIN